MAQDLTSDAGSVDSNGRVQVRDLTLPPSDLWSPQFKRFYAKRARALTSAPPSAVPHPSRTASKTEWDEFDAWSNEYDHGEALAWALGVPRAFSPADRERFAPAGWYMESARNDDAEAYPGSSDAVLAEFPPTLLLGGTRDFTLSTMVVAHARLLKLRVDASLYVMEGAIHGAHVLAVDTPEAQDAQAHIARWFCRNLASGARPVG